MPELNVAVIGCGGIGGTHLTRWSEVSGAHITAVCDADASLALRTATEFGAEAHTDWQSLLDARGLHIVDVCTLPDLHAPIVLRALDRGLHVLCEQPLGRTPDEARAMVEKSEDQDRILMPAFCHRFHPPILFAKELMDNDDLGRIVMFRGRFSGHFQGVEERSFANADVSGGGVLQDTGVHSVDLFRHLVGEVVSATGKIATFNPKLTVEDSAALVLQAKNGALGVIESSWATPGGRNVVELYGTAGACFVDYDTGQVRYRTADMSVWDTREIGGPDRFQREISHFADAVRGLQPPMITGRDGLRANEIIAQVYTAAR
jgi:UDP-N-acetylglucosamine 3-dehydrogenase